MKSLLPSHTNRTEAAAEPLIGRDVIASALPAKGDLSDWVELMEVVEALCPVWPPQAASVGSDYRL